MVLEGPPSVTPLAVLHAHVDPVDVPAGFAFGRLLAFRFLRVLFVRNFLSGLLYNSLPSGW